MISYPWGLRAIDSPKPIHDWDGETDGDLLVVAIPSDGIIDGFGLLELRVRSGAEHLLWTAHLRPHEEDKKACLVATRALSIEELRRWPDEKLRLNLERGRTIAASATLRMNKSKNGSAEASKPCSNEEISALRAIAACQCAMDIYGALREKVDQETSACEAIVNESNELAEKLGVSMRPGPLLAELMTGDLDDLDRLFKEMERLKELVAEWTGQIRPLLGAPDDDPRRRGGLINQIRECRTFYGLEGFGWMNDVQAIQKRRQLLESFEQRRNDDRFGE